jgi:hypothetical protein
MPYTKRDRLTGGMTISVRAYKMWKKGHVLTDWFITHVTQWTALAVVGMSTGMTKVYA